MSDEQPLTRSQSVRYGLGALAVLMAFLIVTAQLVDGLFHLPLRMPATFYNNRPLWIGMAGALILAGWVLQAPPVGDRRKPWSPRHAGCRFRQVRVYGRNGCHLCDEAADHLERYHRWLPPLELVNIDEDPQLVEKFGQQIPVVECDGKVRFRGRISEPLLRRLIEGTPPVS